MSLSLLAPKGKAGYSLTNGKAAVLPREDRATLESDLSALGSPSRGCPLGEQCGKLRKGGDRREFSFR